LFKEQSQKCLPYHQYLQFLKTDVESISSLAEIPFLPIQFFKTHSIIANGKKTAIRFSSSGTTGMVRSQHLVADLSLYEYSFRTAFELFYGDIEKYRFLALLPSYLEREGSSLIYMCEDFIKRSKHPQSGFYLNNLDELSKIIKEDKPTILLGVTYALLDLAELGPFSLNNTIIMETGGMKGKRKEMLKDELHQTLSNAYGVDLIHSEYGMTELLSQAYSKGNGRFSTPHWMRVFSRDIEDPFSLTNNGKTGGLNIIDLANIHSCAFIATQDLGRVYTDKTFEVLGRFEQSDIRGCNLLVQ
jgi:phenylacetate-coenzyme A ligase PaaK-like adenylate-forming protein